VPARLHHERIVRTGAAPARWLAVTHGIYGAGSNWRSIARKLHERRPDWGVVLIDLRGHGKSENGAPPHTVAACADDVRALLEEIGPVDALAGHSFGGKVALASRAGAPGRAIWVLDASPSAVGAMPTGGAVVGLLEFMAAAPRWARREDFVAQVVAAGHDAGLAQWLAMSLVTDPAGGLVVRFDVAALRALLADYFASDLWGALAAPGATVDVVVAARSSTISAADRARLAAMPPHVRTHTIDAGHWLHVEAPEAVIDVLARSLP
jgi:esterase